MTNRKIVEKNIDQKLTFKQAKWLSVYIHTGNATEAAMRAYDCKDRETASNIGGENVRKLRIGDLMDAMGLTDQKLMVKLDEGLEAQRSIAAIAGTEANGGTTDFVDVPDYAVRHKYLDTALKLKGKYPKENQTNIQINNVLPILGGQTVPSNDSNQEIIGVEEKS